jgi:hypothetical protein
MLFKKLIYIYTENHTKQINTLCEQNTELFIIKSCGIYSYHWGLEG